MRNESPNVEELYRELTASLSPFGRSLRDRRDRRRQHATIRSSCWRALQAKDARVRVIRFRRNFGQTAAFAAGFAHARGRYIVTMDGDNQNDPADIPAMIQMLEQHEPRHRLRLAQGSEGPVHQPAAAVDDRQRDHLVRDRREAARLRLLAEGVPRRSREADEAVRRDAPVPAGDRGEFGVEIGEKVVNHRARDARQVELRHHAHVPRRARSDDGEVPQQLFDAAAADVRRCRRFAMGALGTSSAPGWPICGSSDTNRSATGRC